MRHLTVLTFLVAAALLAGCGSGTAGAAPAAVEPVTSQPPTTVAPTTTPSSTTTAEPEPEGKVEVVRDVPYLELNGHEYSLDVYVPDGEGPWPVVIALHGGTVYKGNLTTTAVAKASAEAGMLVFAPDWVATWPSLFAMDAEWMRSEDPAMPCAVAFAQQEAATYGGDASRTVVYGHSAGAASAAMYVLGPTHDLTSGCLVQTSPTAPVGAVLGDAEYFLHANWWDAAFDKDLEAMQMIVAETVDPALWAADLPERFRLWAAGEGSFPRSFDDPWDEDGWFAQRDPDGNIRRDLEELGELGDGVISYIDEGLLLATRLQRAGIDTTFDILPGSHRIDNKLPEIVAYLLDAARTG